MEKRITRATVKSFLKKNDGKIYIQNLRAFDGMVDGERECDDRSFRLAEKDERGFENTMGLKGAWFVGQSRDYLTKYEDEKFIGFHVSNCCGAFNLTVAK